MYIHIAQGGATGTSLAPPAPSQKVNQILNDFYHSDLVVCVNHVHTQSPWQRNAFEG